MTTLKQQIKKALNLPENHFGSHESDLYVKHSVAIMDWVKENVQYWKNCGLFYSKIDHSLWIDIPFGFMEEHYAKKYHLVK